MFVARESLGGENPQAKRTRNRARAFKACSMGVFFRSGGFRHLERVVNDPKGGDLSVTRLKSSESWMEDRTRW